jgi:hypothetical protein
MANPPTTQDITDSLNEVQNLTDQATAYNVVVTAILDGTKNIGLETLKAFGGATLDAAKSLTSLVGDLKTAYDSVSTSAKAMGLDFQVSMDGGGAAVNNLMEPLDRLTARLIKASTLAPFAPMFSDLKTGGATINETGIGFAGMIGKLGEAGGPIGEKIAKGMQIAATAFINNANQSEKLEQSYIALTSQAGNLNELFNTQGGFLVDLSAKTQNYSNQVSAAAGVTGLTVKQTFDFANALKSIPGLFDQQIRTGEGANDNMTSLVGTMKLMTGLGISQADVIKGLTTSYDELSQASGKVTDSAQKGAEFLADVSSVANTLGLRFDDVRGVMESIAKEFQFVGNESDDAAKMLDRYTKALQETGLTGKASLSIVDQMTKSISGMTMGTKAFLSLRSGGPGGLQGAFQIEQLLRQGRLDEVVKMTERNLRQQFGGRVFNQAEAAASPEAAGQFMRQRQLLQSGAFGIGKGLSDEQATRLLEALGKQDFGAVSDTLKTGQDAVKEATDRGAQIQERNNTVLKQIGRTSERAAIAAELQAGITMRQLFGAGGGVGGIPGGRAAGLRTAGTQAETQALEAAGRAVNATSPEAFIKEQALLARQTYGEAFSAIEGLGAGLKEGAVGAGENIVGFGQDFKALLGNKLDKASIEADEALTGRKTKPPTPETRPESIPPAPKTGLESILRNPAIIPASTGTPAGQFIRDAAPNVAQRREQVLATATKNAAPEQDLRRIVAELMAARETHKTKAEVTPPPPQKVILEITAPAGFGARTKTQTENVLVKINSASVMPDSDRGAGY